MILAIYVRVYAMLCQSQMMLLITPVLLLPFADVLQEYTALCKAIFAELFSF